MKNDAILMSQADAFYQAGHVSKAEKLYRELLERDPHNGDLLFRLGTLCLSQGRAAEAEPYLKESAEIKPKDSDLLVNLGLSRLHQGKYESAQKAYEEALEANPHNAKAHNNMGSLLCALDRKAEAAESYLKAIEYKPDYATAHFNLANILYERRLYAESASSYESAIRFQPDYYQAILNLSATYCKLGRYEDSITLLTRSSRYYPNDYRFLNNLGNAKSHLGAFEEAHACYEASLQQKPDYADALNNIGNALKALGRLPQAISSYKKVLEAAPENAECHHNLAMALLANGEFEEGWKEYEWRKKTEQLSRSFRKFSQPLWEGDEGEGRTLLIQSEQGYGDTIQFCRYAPLAAERGFRVILEVQPPLVRLLKSLPFIDKVYARGELLPAFDAHITTLSLPRAFGTTLENIPSSTPYLKAEEEDIQKFASKLEIYATKKKVGLVWAGSARLFSQDLVSVDRRRSIDPGLLGPLFSVPNTRFFSLQKEGPSAPAGYEMENYMPSCRDFADTAALIMNLDLVITVDTAVAHLAGALGKPTWLMDRYDNCWRWLKNRKDSPWYPSLTIYRQREPGDWPSVIQAITLALAAFKPPVQSSQA